MNGTHSLGRITFLITDAHCSVDDHGEYPQQVGTEARAAFDRGTAAPCRALRSVRRRPGSLPVGAPVTGGPFAARRGRDGGDSTRPAAPAPPHERRPCFWEGGAEFALHRTVA